MFFFLKYVFAILGRVDGDMAWSLEQSRFQNVKHSLKKNLNFNRLYAIWIFSYFFTFSTFSCILNRAKFAQILSRSFIVT